MLAAVLQRFDLRCLRDLAVDAERCRALAAR
jgi:hypothetical protein